MCGPDRQIYITADHGMNQKTTILNFGLLADAAALLFESLA